MITINVIENKICGNYGENPFTVDYSKELYDEMQGLADQANNVNTMEQYNDILEAFAQLTIVDYTKTIETQCPYIHINKGTGEFFLKHNGVVSSIPMPEALVDRIFESLDKEIDFMPLVKMWLKVISN